MVVEKEGVSDWCVKILSEFVYQSVVIDRNGEYRKIENRVAQGRKGRGAINSLVRDSFKHVWMLWEVCKNVGANFSLW